MGVRASQRGIMEVTCSNPERGASFIHWSNELVTADLLIYPEIEELFTELGCKELWPASLPATPEHLTKVG